MEDMEMWDTSSKISADEGEFHRRESRRLSGHPSGDEQRSQDEGSPVKRIAKPAQIASKRHKDTDYSNKNILKYLKQVCQDNNDIKKELQEQKGMYSKVIKECEEIKKSMQEMKVQFQRQHNSEAESRPGRKRRQEKQKVDPNCRRTLRNVYNNLKERDKFDLEQRFDSAKNRKVLRRVMKKMYENDEGKDRCKWPDAQIKDASQRYFISLYETKKKITDLKYNDHKTRSRRQGRKKQKLMRRTEALEKAKLNKSEKGMMAELLTEEYMSSEVSDAGDDKGRSNKQKIYIITLPWESKKLKTIKRKLDEEYASHQSVRSQRRKFDRVRDSEDHSSRPKPENCPSWASEKDEVNECRLQSK